MAGKLNTFSGRMVLVIFVIYVVSMPVLYFGLVSVLENGLAHAFVDDVRAVGRLMADNSDDMLDDESGEEVIKLLDSIMLSGKNNFAALAVDGHVLRSSLMVDTDINQFREDFSFGENGDTTYFLSIPLASVSSMGVLQLGFDETPILEHIADARITILKVLLAYLMASVILTVVLSSKMVAPIRRLTRVSRRIATGDYDQTMDVQSGIFEIQALVRDLESMRSNLVGINARLQSEVLERETAEAGKKSLESKLRHAQRLESLGTLAGGVAHEFNNVLQPLMLYAELALEDIPAESKAGRHLERIIELAYDAKGLSQQILTFGRIEGEAELGAANLAPIVDEAMAMVTALLPATVDIRSDIEPDIGFVSCDRRQIQQLIVNLCSNAFQSLSQSAGHIEVRYFHSFVTAEKADALHGLRAGDHAVIEVADTGHGMDQSELRRIFEPFYTTQEVGEGTGLGLSVVHGIVVRHGGSIDVESKEGEGSTFRIYFPIASRERSRRMAIR